MNNNDIMWDSENKRIKIKIHRVEKENDPLKSYCANLGAFNRLVINNCGLETDYREYEEFRTYNVDYIRKEVSSEHPSVMTLIDGLVETLRKKYAVKLESFEQIEELQKIDTKRRKMYASLRVRSNTEDKPTSVILTDSTTTQTTEEAR